MSECLSEQQLEIVASGRLDRAEAGRFQAHLDGCPECREALSEWQANAAFVARFADALPRSSRSSRKSGGSKTPAATAGTQLLDTLPGVPRVDSIPGYSIIREIHRGGQGVVYEAIQRSTRRTVALKVMIDGPFASERARWRFEREVRLIASLKHANIVVVHDSGVSEERHYFAMDYIQGQPLDDYVRAQKLPARRVVELFQQVCDAVSYAHRHGVIHRDLKPSNILVNEDGRPFVLDFGLAKATGDEVLESMQGLVSVPGHLMGTLRYMSPEQTSGKPEEIDIRTDVYSLGVILYELLTGSTPYETTKADITAAIRNIREADPPRISKRHKQIGSELEAIVLKALEKDPKRRYQSAGELGEDLAAWLEGRPVVAKSASSFYVIRKLAVRNGYHTLIAACLTLIVVSFSSVYAHELFEHKATQGELARSRKNTLSLGQQRAQELAGIDRAFEMAREDLLGWLLMEWNAGRQEQARTLAERLRPDSPQKMAAEFLLDENRTAEQLLAAMPVDAQQLAYFVIGERAARAGSRDQALHAFRESAARAMEVNTDELILSLANARLAQLGVEPVRRPQHGKAGSRKDVTRSRG